MSTLPALIGLTGFKQSGKDTVADILTTIAGYERYAFADGVREALYALDPLVGPQTSLRHLVDEHGWDRAKRHRIYGAEVTRLMQHMGTEVGQEFFGGNVWVDNLASEVEAAGGLSPASPVVVTDVRFDHEAHWVLASGGLIWEVIRPGAGPVSTHASESPIDPRLVTRTIPNDSSLPALSTQVALALEASVQARPASVGDAA